MHETAGTTAGSRGRSVTQDSNFAPSVPENVNIEAGVVGGAGASSDTGRGNNDEQASGSDQGGPGGDGSHHDASVTDNDASGDWSSGKQASATASAPAATASAPAAPDESMHHHVRAEPDHSHARQGVGAVTGTERISEGASGAGEVAPAEGRGGDGATDGSDGRDVQGDVQGDGALGSSAVGSVTDASGSQAVASGRESRDREGEVVTDVGAAGTVAEGHMEQVGRSRADGATGNHGHAATVSHDAAGRGVDGGSGDGDGAGEASDSIHSSNNIHGINDINAGARDATAGSADSSTSSSSSARSWGAQGAGGVRDSSDGVSGDAVRSDHVRSDSPARQRGAEANQLPPSDGVTSAGGATPRAAGKVGHPGESSASTSSQNMHHYTAHGISPESAREMQINLRCYSPSGDLMECIEDNEPCGDDASGRGACMLSWLHLLLTAVGYVYVYAQRRTVMGSLSQSSKRLSCAAGTAQTSVCASGVPQEYQVQPSASAPTRKA